MQSRELKTWLAWIIRGAVAGTVLAGVAGHATAACPSWTAGSTVLYTQCSLVGVGTTTPAYNFHVYSNNSSFATEATIQAASHAGDTGLRLVDPDRTWKVGVNVYAGGAGKFNIFDASYQANRLTIDTAGNVGIGTTSPVTRLDVNGTIGVANSGTSLLAGAQLRTYLSNDANWGISNPANAGAGTDEFHVRIHGWGGGSGVKRQFQIVDASASNAVRFSVNFDTGNVTVAGNIAAKYQDVAEWVPSRRQFEAGTVVVVDSERSNGVVSSELPYDTRVAGVISERPGVILGEGGEGKSMVATTGRVRVKVDAGSRAIRVGDLLVTSDREGFAMKSEPLKLGGVPIHRPGTLIGKALEPLEKGQGEILVLLSLQ